MPYYTGADGARLNYHMYWVVQPDEALLKRQAHAGLVRRITNEPEPHA